MMQDFEFMDFLVEYIEFFDEMILLQKRQLDAVLASDLMAVDKIAVEQQVYIKKLSGMERRRMEIQSACGYGTMKFTEIIENVSDAEDKAEYEKLFKLLSQRISDVSFYNTKSREKVNADLAEWNLKESVSYDSQKRQVSKAASVSFETKL